MEKNKIIYSEKLCVFAFSLMPACSCRLCLCQMEGFIREVEILENRTNRMFGMGLVVMGITASYFCESSGFSYIYAVLAALSGGVLIGYRTALHILTAGIVWICRIPPIHEALKKRAVNGGKGYRIGEDGIYDLGTGAMYPYDRLRTVIETKEELSVGSVFTFEKNIDPDQFARRPAAWRLPLLSCLFLPADFCSLHGMSWIVLAFWQCPWTCTGTAFTAKE